MSFCHWRFGPLPFVILNDTNFPSDRNVTGLSLNDTMKPFWLGKSYDYTINIAWSLKIPTSGFPPGTYDVTVGNYSGSGTLTLPTTPRNAQRAATYGVASPPPHNPITEGINPWNLPIINVVGPTLNYVIDFTPGYGGPSVHTTGTTGSIFFWFYFPINLGTDGAGNYKSVARFQIAPASLPPMSGASIGFGLGPGGQDLGLKFELNSSGHPADPIPLNTPNNTPGTITTASGVCRIDFSSFNPP